MRLVDPASNPFEVLLRRCVRVFEAAIAALQLPLQSPVTEADARRGLAELARVRSLVDALEAQLVGVVAERSDAAAAIRGSTPCSQREADRRAGRAETASAVPQLGDSLASGRTTAEHIDVLGRAVEATSAEAVAASDLLRKGETRPPDLLARDVRSFVREHESADDVEKRRRRQRAQRSCSVFPGDNGMWILHAELDPTSGAEVQSALDRAANALFQADGGRGVAGDRRTPTQRRADVLVAMLTGEPTEAEPSPPSVRNQMVLVVTADGGWVPATGETLSPSEIERLACASDLFGLVLSAEGDPLWLGRRRRLASDGQWRALIVRDGGWVICNARAAMCEAHHVVHWEGPSFGPIDIDNLALLCRRHHHELHDRRGVLWHTADGWEMRAPP